jgi:hypothetical protein
MHTLFLPHFFSNCLTKSLVTEAWVTLSHIPTYSYSHTPTHTHERSATHTRTGRRSHTNSATYTRSHTHPHTTVALAATSHESSPWTRYSRSSKGILHISCTLPMLTVCFATLPRWAAPGHEPPNDQYSCNRRLHPNQHTHTTTAP